MPAAHGEQRLAPAAAEKLPTAQPSQTDEAPAEAVPAPQLAHEVPPDEAWAVPAAQSVQEAADEAEYLPATHAVQPPAAAPENVPAAQFGQSATAPAEKVPAPQSSQAPFPARPWL